MLFRSPVGCIRPFFYYIGHAVSPSTMDKLGQPAWSIRRATARDHEGVVELQKRLNRPSRSNSVIREYFLAINEQRIVGCAAVRKSGNRGYLYGLAVDKPWRRRGVGHALTQKRLDWLRGQNVVSAFVMAMFWNVRFFKKHGFIVTKKGAMTELKQLHSDFKDSWSTRSALLVADLSLSSLAVSGTRGKNEQWNIRS